MAEDLTPLSFEDALRRLEAIVHELESGDLPLDVAIDKYQQGDQLRTQCEARLKDAQARIEKITLSADGRPTGVQPLDAD